MMIFGLMVEHYLLLPHHILINNVLLLIPNNFPLAAENALLLHFDYLGKGRGEGAPVLSKGHLYWDAPAQGKQLVQLIIIGVIIGVDILLNLVIIINQVIILIIIVDVGIGVVDSLEVGHGVYLKLINGL
jgi:hypothetical protein